MQWNLGDLYSNYDATKDDLLILAKMAKDFHDNYQDFTGKLYVAIQDLEKLENLMGRLLTFGYLTVCTNRQDQKIGAFWQKLQESITTISQDLVFFPLNLSLIDDETLRNEIAIAPELERYAYWINVQRKLKEHQLSLELEQLMQDKALSGSSAWVRLFDETLAEIAFECQGQKYNLATLCHLFHSADADLRRDAAFALHAGLNSILPLLTRITNNLAKEKSINDHWRKFKHPMESRNFSNQIEDEVIECLLQTVRNNYKKLAHRYYEIKAKILGMDKLMYWDRMAPLPNSDTNNISWPEAQDIVLKAYGKFFPKMADLAQQFFDHNWIDSLPKDGKDSGAFSHPCVSDVHPYILLNYQGSLRDVATLAHELGHGVHQLLAAKQGDILSSTPLTLAETASVFGEMLVFQSLLAKTDDVDSKRNLLASKLDDMLATVVRQVAFCTFEQEVHNRRKKQELSTQELNDLWLKTQKEALGEYVVFPEQSENLWSYIPHFIHTPFYVYSYAFGDCLVNSLYAYYQKNQDGFAEKFFALLSAGGSQSYADLLQPFGFDLKHSDFWQQGLNFIADLLDQLEQLSNADKSVYI